MSDHWRSYFDSRYLGNWDLPVDRDCIVEIAGVEGVELTSAGGRKDKKPLVKFVGKEKGLALNKTNAKAIAAMYGDRTSAWRGKLIALYVTEVSSPDGMVPAIRIRPKKPRGRAAPQPPPNEPEPSVPEGDAGGDA